jgi:hypothetical protein
MKKHYLLDQNIDGRMIFVEVLSYYVIIKGKIVPVHAMKLYGGIEVQLHSFLSKVLDEVCDKLQSLVDLRRRERSRDTH